MRVLLGICVFLLALTFVLYITIPIMDLYVRTIHEFWTRIFELIGGTT